MTWKKVALAAVLIVTAGCSPARPSLTVRVQSGFRAGPEASWVEAIFYAGRADCDGTETGRDGRALAPRDQEALGAGMLTVAELRDLALGTHAVRVRLRRPSPGGLGDSGAVLVERCVVTTLANDRVLRVPLGTACQGVTCPRPDGTPGFGECLEGRCVDPRCDPDDPATEPLCCDRALLGDACDEEPTFCTGDEDCAPSAACAGAPVCRSRVCIEPTEDLCPGETYCDHAMNACAASTSVVDDAGPRDAGTLDAPSIDAPSIDAATLDACVVGGEPCTGLDEDCDGAIDEHCRVPIHRGIRMTPVLAYRYSADLGVLGMDGYAIDSGSRFHLYAARTGLATVAFFDCQFADGSSRLTRSPTCDDLVGALPPRIVGYGVDPNDEGEGGCRNLFVASRDNGAIALSYFHAHPLVSDGPAGGRWGAEDQTPPNQRTICAWDTGTL